MSSSCLHFSTEWEVLRVPGQRLRLPRRPSGRDVAAVFRRHVFRAHTAFFSINVKKKISVFRNLMTSELKKWPDSRMAASEYRIIHLGSWVMEFYQKGKKRSGKGESGEIKGEEMLTDEKSFFLK